MLATTVTAIEHVILTRRESILQLKKPCMRRDKETDMCHKKILLGSSTTPHLLLLLETFKGQPRARLVIDVYMWTDVCLAIWGFVQVPILVIPIEELLLKLVLQMLSTDFSPKIYI